MWASAIIAAARQPTIQAQAPLARQGQSMYSQAMAGSRVIHPSPVQRAPQLLPMSTLEPGKLYPVVQLPAGHAMQVAPSLQRVFLGLGWTNATSGKTVDVDASCIAFSGGQPKGAVWCSVGWQAMDGQILPYIAHGWLSI